MQFCPQGVVVGIGTRIARARKIPAPAFPSRGGLSSWRPETYSIKQKEENESSKGKSVQMIPGYSFHSNRKQPVPGDLAFSNDHKQRPVRIPTGRALRNQTHGRPLDLSLPSFLTPVTSRPALQEWLPPERDYERGDAEPPCGGLVDVAHPIPRSRSVLADQPRGRAAASPARPK